MYSFLFFAFQAVDSSKMMAKKVQEMVHNSDPYGVGMTAIGMTIVFSSLIVLYLVFYYLTKFLNRRMVKSGEKQGKTKEEVEKEIDISGDVHAAIGMALHLYLSEVHDFENTVLTINRVSKNYSPWSSKIYGLRQMPYKRQ